MTVALASSIESLLQRKAELLREVAEIDAELERAALALQGVARQGRPRPIRQNYRRDLRVAGSVPNDIYAALAVREPQSIKELADHLKVKLPNLGVQCHRMAMGGQLSRVRVHGMGRTYLYARTSSALTAPTITHIESEGTADAAG